MVIARSVRSTLAVLFAAFVFAACAVRHPDPSSNASAASTTPAAPPASSGPSAQAAPSTPAPATPPAPAPPPPPPPAEPGSVVADLVKEGQAVDPLVRADWVKRFLASAAGLPPISPRKIYFDADRKHFYSETETALLSDASRAVALFGPPTVPLDTLVAWQADWLARGMPTLAKPTGFEVRDGSF